MPLLYKKDFEEKEFPSGLSDSDEVFFCELTEEVFTDYEEFCERIYLCNSLVWTCSVTGRTNLTYLEAFLSEQNARKQLAEFPLTLRIPILYLITISDRKSLAELAEDIFIFVRDRYFVGETVEVCFANETWCDCHIIQVTFPTDKVIQEYQASHSNINRNNNNATREFWPPSSLYSYEVEIVTNPNKDGLTYFVRGDQVRRRKGWFTRDKNKLFIKQFVNQESGIWKLKDQFYKKYAIDKVKFDEIFAGNSSCFLLKKKTGKEPTNNKINDKLKMQMKKERKQESIQKYFKQKPGMTSSKSSQVNGINKKLASQKNPPFALQQKSLIQKLKNKYKGVKKTNLMNKISNKKDELKEKTKLNKQKIREDFNNSLSRDELLRIAFQCKDKNLSGVRSVGVNLKLNKENRRRLYELVIELNRRREDLECEDLKDLPEPTAVQIGVPNKYFGDLVMILEFLHSFGRIINMKNYFPFGVNIELVERALMKNEVAGPMNDLLQLLLTAVFDLQEQHDMIENDVSKLDGNDWAENSKNEHEKLLALSNAAAAYSHNFQGMPLNQLTLDCATISEILRLHFMSSGRFRLSDDPSIDRNSLNLDDPGRNLCLNNPELIKLLSHKSIFELSIEHRITIIDCLINQILMFSSVREAIDERVEKVKTGRIDLRVQEAAEIKKKKEALVKAKEQKENGVLTAEQTEAIKDNRSRKMAELHRKARDLCDAEMEFQVVPLGADRAHRRFWLFSSLPGLFVEDDEPVSGPCLPKGTPYAEDAEACLKYVRKLFEDGGLSNKENFVGVNKDHLSLSAPINTGSPSKKMLAEKNGSPPGEIPSFSGNNKTTPSRSNSKMEIKNACKPLTCWGDPLMCPVHGIRPPSKQDTIWSFYKSEDDVNKLIESLNSRGHREFKLKKTLSQQKQRIIDSLSKCPLSKLDPNEINNEPNEVRKSSRVGPKYENPNLDFPPNTPVEDVLEFNLRDMILETEEKIFGGLLGSLKVENREEWRKALKENRFDKQCDILSWGPESSTRTSTNRDVNGPGAESSSVVVKIIQEGVVSANNSRCNTPTSLFGIEKSTKTEDGNEPVTRNVYNLACAILQLSQAVEHRYLKKPLGDETDNVQQDASTSVPPLSTSSQNYQNQNKKRKNKASVRERWEESLMTSNSLSQLFIHFYTLENCIEWSKSALKTYSCKVCRNRDPDKMLLCDSCNKGYHMYCLKPKLTKVPEEDWFCPKCQQNQDKEKSKKEKATTSRRSQPQEEETEKNEPEGVVGKCKVCRTRGELAMCDDCNHGFHLECISPPLRKFPRFTWTCPNCRHQSAAAGGTGSNTNRRSAKYNSEKSDYSDDDGDEDVSDNPSDSDDNSSNDVERCPSRRRCAKTATAKITRFAKQLRTNSWDGEQFDDNKDTGTVSSSRRRSRRSMEASTDVTTTSSNKDLPLDNAALQEILEIVMHHKDAWPFLRPVTKSEVPDYHTIIKTPMDFGTVKHKLNMLEYNKNSQVIADAMLVFNNCYTYNQSDSEVYKAGERLQKVFEKLCNERKMKICNRKNIENEDDVRPPNGKKPRTVF